MSWQTYVDDQLLATKIVKYAVICGHDGTVWAKSAGFNVSDNELKVLLAKYDKPEEMGVCGPTIAGKMFMYLSSFENKVPTQLIVVSREEFWQDFPRDFHLKPRSFASRRVPVDVTASRPNRP